MLAAAVVGMLKTMLVTVNGVVATEFNVSYMATTALTGLPMIVASVAGLGAGVLAQVIGKRVVYLVSGVLMLAAMLWNMHVMESYAQFMASRIFQGVGWGATEALVLGSIKDIYFVSLSDF
jgi:nitrate/nitrite transporter NarK